MEFSSLMRRRILLIFRALIFCIFYTSSKMFVGMQCLTMLAHSCSHSKSEFFPFCSVSFGCCCFISSVDVPFQMASSLSFRLFSLSVRIRSKMSWIMTGKSHKFIQNYIYIPTYWRPYKCVLHYTISALYTMCVCVCSLYVLFLLIKPHFMVSQNVNVFPFSTE